MTGTLTLHCYQGAVDENDRLSVVDWSDAAAVKLELDEFAQKLYERALHHRERLGRYEIGEPVLLTDKATRQRYLVASAPCGLGCHCAAVAACRETA